MAFRLHRVCICGEREREREREREEEGRHRPASNLCESCAEGRRGGVMALVPRLCTAARSLLSFHPARGAPSPPIVYRNLIMARRGHVKFMSGLERCNDQISPRLNNPGAEAFAPFFDLSPLSPPSPPPPTIDGFNLESSLRRRRNVIVIREERGSGKPEPCCRVISRPISSRAWTNC